MQHKKLMSHLVNNGYILKGIKKAIQKMIDKKVLLNQDIVLVDKDGKLYCINAKDFKKQLKV